MYDRRAVLQGCGVGLAVGVAGCSGSPDDTDTPDNSDTPEGTDDGSNGGDGPQEVRVEMTDDLVFNPKEVTVAVGDTVVWETTGAVAHSVTAYGDDLPEGAAYFASGEFDTEEAAREAYPEGASVGEGETYSHTFETPGEFPYFCIPHESGMRGTVIVED